VVAKLVHAPFLSIDVPIRAGRERNKRCCVFSIDSLRKWSLSGVCMGANSAVLEMLGGVSNAELQRLNLDTLVHPDDFPLLRTALTEFIKLQQPELSHLVRLRVKKDWKTG
jgi:PAS domain-containing protein